jgi:hypothetical protein
VTIAQNRRTFSLHRHFHERSEWKKGEPSDLRTTEGPQEGLMPRPLVLGAAPMWIALPTVRRPQARQEKEIDTCYASE